MTKAEFYHRALLAVAPTVTQAYILKHSLPFAKDAQDADVRVEERFNEMESIAEMADMLAVKLTGYWKDTDDYFQDEEDDNKAN